MAYCVGPLADARLAVDALQMAADTIVGYAEATCYPPVAADRGQLGPAPLAHASRRIVRQCPIRPPAPASTRPSQVVVAIGVEEPSQDNAADFTAAHPRACVIHAAPVRGEDGVKGARQDDVVRREVCQQ